MDLEALDIIGANQAIFMDLLDHLERHLHLKALLVHPKIKSILLLIFL
jgi:hypothetical protein